MTPLARRIRRLFPMPTITGYDDPRIAATVAAKTLRYDPILRPIINNEVRVLDFGGGCGVHFREAAGYTYNVNWAIVETPSMVVQARARYHSTHLSYHNNIESAKLWLGAAPDLIICDGALQYTKDPKAIMVELVSLGAQTIHYRRTGVVEGHPRSYCQHSYLSDHGPGPAWGPEARVHTWVTPIRYSMFLNAHWQYNMSHPATDEFIFTRKAPHV